MAINDSVSAISGIVARWRADQITGLTSGAAVSSWPDDSANGYHATQAASLSMPTWQAAAIGGQPTVRFTGSSNHWLASAAPAGDSAQTLVAVLKLNTITNVRTIRAGYLNEFSNNGDGAIQFRIESNGMPGLVHQNIVNLGTATTAITTDATSVVATFSDAADSFGFRVAGSDAGGGTTTVTLTARTTRIGGHPYNTGEAFDGDMAELIVFNRVLTATELDTVQSYIEVRYFGALAVPSGRTATPVSDSQINLAWNPVTGATGYDIERDGVVIVTDHASTTYADTGLVANTEHDYRVRSVG